MKIFEIRETTSLTCSSDFLVADADFSVAAFAVRLFVGELSVGELSVSELSVGELSVSELSVGELSVGESVAEFIAELSIPDFAAGCSVADVFLFLEIVYSISFFRLTFLDTTSTTRFRTSRMLSERLAPSGSLSTEQ